MNEFINKYGKELFWLIGLVIPILLIIAQMAVGNLSSPLTILMFTWFGISLFIYIGADNEN